MRSGGTQRLEALSVGFAVSACSVSDGGSSVPGGGSVPVPCGYSISTPLSPHISPRLPKSPFHSRGGGAVIESLSATDPSTLIRGKRTPLQLTLQLHTITLQAAATTLAQLVERARSLRSPSSSTACGDGGGLAVHAHTIFYLQLALTAVGTAVQLRLSRMRTHARHAHGGRDRAASLFRLADRIIAPLLFIERRLKRHALLIFCLQFNM